MRRRLLRPLCLSLLTVAAAACANKAVAPEQLTPLPTDTVTVGVFVDGITLTGRLFGGQNDTLVILSHMRQNDETAWFPFAEELAGKGYAALTFNFRGYDGSGGHQDYDKLDEDLEAVINYVRATGKKRIFLVGASMGATTSLVVATREDVAGIVAVSPPAQFDSQDALKAVANVTAPKLFIASEEDAPALDFDDLVTAAAGPKEEDVYPGDAHGMDLLDPSKNAAAGSVEERILSFLQEQGGP
jgi:pimeloyl-ACP methyl ester carboxylesterase